MALTIFCPVYEFYLWELEDILITILSALMILFALFIYFCNKLQLNIYKTIPKLLPQGPNKIHTIKVFYGKL